MIIQSYQITTNYTRIRDNTSIKYHRTKTVYDIGCDNCSKIFSKTLNKRQKRKTALHFCEECFSLGNIARLAGHQVKIKNSETKIGERRDGSGKYPEIYVGYNSGYTTSQGNWAREHIYVMEKHLGFKIPKGFVVHHIDGDKKNNNINNLSMLTVQEHNNAHAKSEKIIFDLVKKGIVIFNRETKLYELNETPL